MPKLKTGNQHSAMKAVLSAIKKLSDRTDKRFGGIDQRFDEVFEVVNFIKDNAVTKAEFNDVKTEVGSLKTEVGSLKEDVDGIKIRMVTKDYLDDKLADLRGDLVVMTRKGDNKLLTLVDVLRGKKVLNNKDVKRILALEPFAR